MTLDGAQWIGTGECESPLLRREFDLARPVNAKIAICGLGYFELYCNGRKVSTDLLTPAWSQYDSYAGKRSFYAFNDEMSSRVYYLEYDLSEYVTAGKNAIGIWLGNGWYNQHERVIEGDFWFDKPKAIFRLRLEDQEEVRFIDSDTQTMWRPSMIVSNNIYYGEIQDLSLQVSDWDAADYVMGKEWRNTIAAEAPKGKLVLQSCPPDRVIRTVKPVCIGEYEGSRLYDAGENITGWAVLQSHSAGKVTVKYDEYLHESGQFEFFPGDTPDKLQQDIFLCTGEQTLKPHFTWHGFQYFVVTGDAEPLYCEVVHSDIHSTSCFKSDNETLNWLYDAYIRTQLGNYHGGVPSDCPHRERLGYTGDGQLTAQTALLLTDSEMLYDKWIDDILDCQDKRGGHVQHTAPFYGGGGGPGGWGCAIVEVPWALYLKTGDTTVLEKTYEPMLHWLKYMSRHSENGLVTNEYPDGMDAVEKEQCWCLGDWCTPDPIRLPEAFVNTYFYIKSLRCVLHISDILDITSDQEQLKQWLDTAINGMIDAYYDDQTGDFCEGVQGANAFAVDLNLGDHRTLQNLVEKYRDIPLDTGIFGTDILIRVLFENGHGADAIRLICYPQEPSFEKMRQMGSTTIWETWNGKGSRNHPMFGAVVRYLFRYLLGIKQVEPKPGCPPEWDIKPQMQKELPSCEGYITTIEGKKIRVSVDRMNSTYHVTVE